jgi:hypothetical protein
VDVEKRKISFPSLGFELQSVQPVRSYSTDLCCSIVGDTFAMLGNCKTLKKAASSGTDENHSSLSQSFAGNIDL